MFKLLLLSIYAIAAQQVPGEMVMVGEARFPPGQFYFEQAKHLLST